MLAVRIIPCLDVIGERTVKGVHFLNLQEAGDAVLLASRYSDHGADELVLLDISASQEGRKTFIRVVEKVARALHIPFTVGGGISDIEDIRRLLKAGADKVSLNTAIVTTPSLINQAAKEFGSQCIVAAIDARRKVSRNAGDSPPGESPGEEMWELYIMGGKKATGIDAVRWAQEAAERGAGEILLTSMDRDGTLEGYDLDLLKAVSESVTVPVIASGGAGKKEDVLEAIVRGKADAVLIASLFHYSMLSIQDLKEYLSAHGVAVRR